MNWRVVTGCVAIAVLGTKAVGVPPTIHVTWSESPPPLAPVDYEIFNPTSDFPDVELKAESLTWRIWATDPDNPGGLGEIGVISSPYPKNFGVKIEDDEGGPGALNVLGINLDPTSGSNYSNITGGSISGDLSTYLGGGASGGPRWASSLTQR